MSLEINSMRLLSHIKELGQVGRDESGRLMRLAASRADKLGRDRLVSWMGDAGLDVSIDAVGNIFGVWATPENADRDPVMAGSHIDSVINAGIYDGCYGVLAALEVIETLKASGQKPDRPLAAVAFTNEEGVRYSPTMMGSLVYAGDMSLDEAFATKGIDGTLLGDELRQIGYVGPETPGHIRPASYVELHVEQGPVLEAEGITIGAVESIQGVSWQILTVEGAANHAGTTPMSMRHDAGHAAARIISFVHDRRHRTDASSVSTVGRITFEPNVINTIPARAVFTVDMRDPDEARLKGAEAALDGFIEDVAKEQGVTLSKERLVRFEPVLFDQNIVAMAEKAARDRGLSVRRMTSGAAHDAKPLAKLVPTAMIFVPSVGGISHNPDELTHDAHITAGANVLLDVLAQLSGLKT